MDEILSVIKELSVSWIELWTFNLLGGFEGYQCKEEDLERTKEILESHGVGAACVTNGGASRLAEQPDQYISSMKETINVAKELGASFINCYSGRFTERRHDADISRLVEVMRPIVEYAEDNCVTVVLENEAHDASGTPEGMLKILKALESDFFKTNFDATNYYQANVEPYPYAYDVLKEYVAYVHIKNGCVFNPAAHSKEARGGTFAPPKESNFIFYSPVTDGAVNIEGLLRSLKKDGYSGFCTLEPHVRSFEKLMEYYQIEIEYLHEKGIN